MGTSPILIGDLLVVQVDHTSTSYLLGVDASTGANSLRSSRRKPTTLWVPTVTISVRS